MISEQDRQNAKILWDYNYITDDVGDADLLLVMGSNDIRVPVHAVSLTKKYAYNYIICSGGIAHQGDLLETGWEGSEAKTFANIMQKNGVPDVLQETKAHNTGDNILLSRALIEEKGVQIKTGVLVQKPFMLRRAIATAQKQWPEVEWKVSAEDISYKDYMAHFDEEKLIHIIVGDTARHKIYAEKGFQIEQEMPEDVLAAKEALIKNGFTKRLPDQ